MREETPAKEGLGSPYKKTHEVRPGYSLSYARPAPRGDSVPDKTGAMTIEGYYEAIAVAPAAALVAVGPSW